jgi:hypothetical protein
LVKTYQTATSSFLATATTAFERPRCGWRFSKSSIQWGWCLTASYVYDGDGNRVKTDVNGVVTHYIGNYYEVKNPGTGQTYKKYFYAGATRVAMSENGTVRYFVTDHLGSTTKMINADGSKYPSEINFEIKYASWGSDLPNIPNLGTSFKYTGQRHAEPPKCGGVGGQSEAEARHFIVWYRNTSTQWR